MGAARGGLAVTGVASSDALRAPHTEKRLKLFSGKRPRFISEEHWHAMLNAKRDPRPRRYQQTISPADTGWQVNQRLLTNWTN